MDLLGLLIGKKKKRARAHLNNLMQLAESDGNFDAIEINYLLSLAERFKITEAELKHMKDNPRTVPYDAPTNDRERFDYLHQLVCMMLIDGEIHEQEMSICKRYAEKLSLRAEFVDDFVRVIGDSVDQEIPSNVIIAKLLTVAQERESARLQQPESLPS